MPKQRNYIFKLYPDEEQAKKLELFMGYCRFVWNKFIEINKERMDKGEEPLKSFKTASELTKLKNQKEYEFLNEISRSMLSRTLLELSGAFSCYIKGTRELPVFLTKDKNMVLTVGNHCKEEEGKFWVAKIGWVKTNKKDKLKGKFLSYKVIKKSDSWILKIRTVENVETELSAQDLNSKELYWTRYKTKIKPTKKQEAQLNQYAEARKFVWNYYLKENIFRLAHNRENILTYFDLTDSLTELLKLDGYKFLKLVPREVMDASLKDLDLAISYFFKHDHTRHRRSFPKIKQDEDHLTFRVRHNLEINKNKIKVSGISYIRFFKGKDIQGKIKNVTFKKEANSWYISIESEVEQEPVINNNPDIGIDMGKNNIIATSNGKLYKGIEEYSRLETNVKNQQNIMSRQKKYSSNWRRTQLRLQKLSLKITNKNKDYRHKVTTEIVNSSNNIVLEDLRVKLMTKNEKGTVEEPNINSRLKSHQNKNNLRQGWFRLREYFIYKSLRQGGKVHIVNPAYTSQTCSDCGYVNPKNRDEEEFLCLDKECGYVDHADINAAKNMLAKATPSIEKRRNNCKNNPKASGACFRKQTY